jgi:hypothetical protein
LYRLDLLRGCSEVRFLTRHPEKAEASFLDRALREFVSEHPNIHLRRTRSRDVHDRFLLSDDALILVGHGLKDLGAKESFVIHLPITVIGDIAVSVRESFDANWTNAEPLVKP